MGRSLVRALLALALLVAAGPARANDLDVGLLAKVPAGRQPAVTVTLHKAVRRLTLRLQGDDGRRLTLTRHRLPLGRKVVLPLRQGVGRVAWRGRLEVRFADGTKGAMPLHFETVVAAPIHLTAVATRDDVLAGHAVVRADHPVRQVTVKVFGEKGAPLGTTVLPFHDAAPGTPLKLAWTRSGPGTPLRVEVTVTDPDGITGGLTWYPWEVRIPHREVRFDTGEAVIRPDQVGKLKSVLAALRAALRRYGRVAKVSLWIAGHTDTVGTAAANQVLSEDRARAIARWFEAQGISVPIHYRGLGETAPAVATPDETAEPRNRRADYLVAASDPLAGKTLAGHWTRLKDTGGGHRAPGG